MIPPLDWAEIIFLSFSCAAFLLAWFETNVIYEYLNFFNVGGKFLHGYNEYRKKDYANLSFIAFLLVNHNCFFTKLIGCSICLAFWINLLINLFFFNCFHLPFTFILSLLIYYIISLFKKLLEKW